MAEFFFRTSLREKISSDIGVRKTSRMDMFPLKNSRGHFSRFALAKIDGGAVCTL